MFDYLATNPDATIRFHASDMVLNIHSDASYLSSENAKSRASGHFFLGSVPKDGEPITLNGVIFTLCTILKSVASSAAEAELGALFVNVKERCTVRLALAELGHPQPLTPIHCDNATATGIANGIIKNNAPAPWNAIFLRLGPSETQAIWREMVPRSRKLRWLHHQTSPCTAPYTSTSHLLADE